jgi:hypothetical protein
MKIFYFTVFICSVFSISVAAQNRPRVFDNFDTPQGVQVSAPTVAPLAQPNSKHLVKKTAQTKMSVEEGAAFKDLKKTCYQQQIFNGCRFELEGFYDGQ